MPYKSNKELPAEIKKLPNKAQDMFRESFNSSIKRVSEDVAFKVAWAVVKKRFKKVNGSWVSKSMGITLFSFNLENTENSFVTKGSDGEFYWQGTLSDTLADGDGNSFSLDALTDFASQINEFGIAGFIEHDDWKEFLMENGHLDEQAFISKARSSRNGILKTVKAIIQDGKLMIKALIDKRYINKIKQFTKVSIEALVPPQFRKGKVYTGGTPLGFALTKTPVNPRAKGQIKYE